MNKMLIAALAFLAPLACAALNEDPDDEVDEATKAEAVGASTDALGRTCYCTGAFACKSSRSANYMYSGARAALAAAGVPESALTQTYGDATASVGTHCPEPGKTYSAAADMQQGANPCDRVRKLRAQGFAAWYRTAPFAPHIHAVYAGAPGMKASLERQVASFLQGRNGLAGNAVETNCAISEADKAAVRAALAGDASSPPPQGRCVENGTYCGGDKVPGDPNTLYRCNADGTVTAIERCANGCSINPGRNDTCNPP